MLRGSAWKQYCILNVLPLGVIWAPAALPTHTCICTLQPPIQLPHPTAEKWRNPSCVSCQPKTSPIKAWDCQYPASIVQISQLALCQHFSATGGCSVKVNFSFSANSFFFFWFCFFYCKELLPNIIVSHFFHTLNNMCTGIWRWWQIKAPWTSVKLAWKCVNVSFKTFPWLQLSLHAAHSSLRALLTKF